MGQAPEKERRGFPAFFLSVAGARSASGGGATERGFTTIELVVTMIIVGALAFMILPRFAALDDFDSVGYTNQLKSVLRYAQKTAVAQRRQTLVAYSRIAVTMCSEPHSDAPVCPGAVDCSLGGRTALPPPGGAFRAGPASITGSGIVCFNARGEAYGGAGGINLDGIAGDEITIVAATGYVR